MTRLVIRENFRRKPRGYWGRPHPVTSTSDTASWMMMIIMMMVYSETHFLVHPQYQKPNFLSVPTSVLTVLSINSSRKMIKSMNQASTTQIRPRECLVFSPLIPTLQNSLPLFQEMSSCLSWNASQFREDWASNHHLPGFLKHSIFCIGQFYCLHSLPRYPEKSL